MRYANVLIDTYGTLDKDTAYQFQVDRTNACIVIAVFMLLFFNLIAPPSGKASQIVLLTKDCAHTLCAEFGEDISFCSQVIAFFLSNWPSTFERVGAPLQQ